jgi:hypothetical protein
MQHSGSARFGRAGNGWQSAQFLSRHIGRIKVADLIVDQTRVPHAPARIEKNFSHPDFAMGWETAGMRHATRTKFSIVSRFLGRYRPNADGSERGTAVPIGSTAPYLM